MEKRSLEDEYNEWAKNHCNGSDDREKLQTILEKVLCELDASKDHALTLSWALDGKKDALSFEKVKDMLKHMTNPNNWKTFSEISKGNIKEQYP